MTNPAKTPAPLAHDVLRFSETCPAIEHHYGNHLDGLLTWEQSLMAMVIELVHERRVLLARLGEPLPPDKPSFLQRVTPQSPAP